MKTSKKGKTKQSKQEILAGRIERAARIIRTLPDTLNPQAQFEDEGEPHKLPYKPTEWWLLNAGAHVRGAMRLGCFKDYENMLLSTDGEMALWKELIRIIKKRAGLPFPRDYLQTFAEDCQLVADALEKESKQPAEKKQSEEKWSAEDKLITALLHATLEDHYTSLTAICKNANVSRTTAYNSKKFKSMFQSYKAER